MQLKEIAEKLNLSPRRCQQYAESGIFPRRGQRGYDLTACAIAYALYLRGPGESDTALLCSTNELARCVGQTIGNVRYLEKRGIFKQVCRNRFDLIPSVHNFIEYAVQKKRSGRKSSGGALL